MIVRRRSHLFGRVGRRLFRPTAVLSAMIAMAAVYSNMVFCGLSAMPARPRSWSLSVSISKARADTGESGQRM